MKIEVKTKNVINDGPVREFIDRKVKIALERIESHVRSVTVRLEDEKGKNKSIFDGLCRIEVDLEPKGDVHVSAHGESAFDCVQQAIRKMEHAVKHDLDRHRKSSKIRHQQTKRKMNESLESLDDMKVTDSSTD